LDHSFGVSYPWFGRPIAFKPLVEDQHSMNECVAMQTLHLMVGPGKKKEGAGVSVFSSTACPQCPKTSHQAPHVKGSILT
jgi:hypothetical protein